MDEDQRAGLLRVVALLGSVALPMAWIVSLIGRPEFQMANLARVVGAIAVAGSVWMVSRRRGTRPKWARYLTSGVIGSLVVTGLSVVFPTLGSYAISGWLVSGVVGGASVALIAYGLPPSRRNQGPT